jgi:hypothetical protein
MGQDCLSVFFPPPIVALSERDCYRDESGVPHPSTLRERS